MGVTESSIEYGCCTCALGARDVNLLHSKVFDTKFVKVLGQTDDSRSGWCYLTLTLTSGCYGCSNASNFNWTLSRTMMAL